MAITRSDGRQASEMRSLEIITSTNPYADGSAEVRFGSTKVILSALLREGGTGSISATLSMLPCATRLRVTDAGAALPQEVRFIESVVSHTLGSSLAAASVDSLDIELYASVCVADGGVAAAVVAGGWVAMYQTLSTAVERGIVTEDLDLPRVATLAAGIVDDELRLDLLSEETTNASFQHIVSANVQREILSLHSEAKTDAIPQSDINSLTALCLSSLDLIFDAQARALA